MVPDQTFVLHEGQQEVWKVIIDGTVIPAEFSSKGAAEAAIPVERARRARKAQA